MRRLALLAPALLLLAVVACSNEDSEPVGTGTGGMSTPPTSAPPTTNRAETTTSLAGPSLPTTVPPLPPSPIPARTVDELVALDRPIVLAHSGGEDAFPSETMYAFGQSALAGVDMLDLNLRLSRDGVLVAFHDDTLDRTTNGTGPIGDLTVGEIQALDAAYWFTADCSACTGRPDAEYLYRGISTGEVEPPNGTRAEDFRVPTLQEVVARFPLAPLNVEIKGDGDEGIATAIALSSFIADNPTVLDRMVVSSFDDAVLDRFSELQPDVELSPGLNAVAAWVLTRTPLPDGIRILQIPPSFEGTEVITEQLVVDSTAAGYPIWVWPNDRDLENEQAYRAFLELGVRGLNINQPAQGVAAVQAFTGS